MNRPRDRASAAGLLARMESRPWKDGKTVSYRYHPVGAKPWPWTTDRDALMRRILAANGPQQPGSDRRDLAWYWRTYQESAAWQELKPRTQADYEDYSVPLLRVFGAMLPRDLLAPMVARYLRVERRDAPVRANREVALLGNLVALAIEHGEADRNPCRGGQVKRNKERPQKALPDIAQLEALIAFAATKGGRWPVITMAAEFAALAGPRQMEFLPLTWPYFGTTEVRWFRGKQRKGVEKVEVVQVSAQLLELRTRLQAVAANPTLGTVFPNRHGNAYTSAGFASQWGKLMREAVAKGIVTQRFTFHALRAYYTTEYKRRTGQLADLHASPTTTATVYERSKVARRGSL